jgi:hypothetical protein
MVEAIQVSERESEVRSWPCFFCLWVVLVMMVPLGLWGGWDLKGRGWCGHNDGDRENNNRETWWWWWFILALK